jgi:hypothetical protein
MTPEFFAQSRLSFTKVICIFGRVGVKGKVIPATDREGPWGFEKSRPPTFST